MNERWTDDILNSVLLILTYKAIASFSHGRLKVRTSEEQKALKEKEHQKKLVAYQAGIDQILSSRKPDSYDPECFALSTQLLMANADIYTLWNYRKEVILIEKEACGENGIEGEEKIVNLLETELKLTEQSLLANPKSYGSWHHRYWAMMNHPKPRWNDEFKLCTKYLNMDDRNFHCWDYRRLLVNKIGISLEDELNFPMID
nr:unnamed protein product [Callosobruchus chinensis]